MGSPHHRNNCFTCYLPKTKKDEWVRRGAEGDGEVGKKEPVGHEKVSFMEECFSNRWKCFGELSWRERRERVR